MSLPFALGAAVVLLRDSSTRLLSMLFPGIAAGVLLCMVFHDLLDSTDVFVSTRVWAGLPVFVLGAATGAGVIFFVRKNTSLKFAKRNASFPSWLAGAVLLALGFHGFSEGMLARTGFVGLLYHAAPLPYSALIPFEIHRVLEGMTLAGVLFLAGARRISIVSVTAIGSLFLFAGFQLVPLMTAYDPIWLVIEMTFVSAFSGGIMLGVAGIGVLPLAFQKETAAFSSRLIIATLIVMISLTEMAHIFAILPA